MPVPIQYTESMHALLDWFNEYPCQCATVGHIASQTGYSRETIRGNLKQLAAAGHANLQFEPNGEYRLVDDPRD